MDIPNMYVGHNTEEFIYWRQIVISVYTNPPTPSLAVAVTL